MRLNPFSGICGKKYLQQKPAFDLRSYFDGKLKAYGIVQNRRGDIIRRFDIDMVGRWQGNDGTLEEKFHYYDGEKQTRIWRIKDLGDGRYEGRADDIMGKADGIGFGGAGRWCYVMEVPVKNKKIRLRFDDWMWAMHDDVVVNRSYMKKFGIKVAEISIFMRKL